MNNNERRPLSVLSQPNRKRSLLNSSFDPFAGESPKPLQSKRKKISFSQIASQHKFAAKEVNQNKTTNQVTVVTQSIFSRPKSSLSSIARLSHLSTEEPRIRVSQLAPKIRTGNYSQFVSYAFNTKFKHINKLLHFKLLVDKTQTNALLNQIYTYTNSLAGWFKSTNHENVSTTATTDGPSHTVLKVNKLSKFVYACQIQTLECDSTNQVLLIRVDTGFKLRTEESIFLGPMDSVMEIAGVPVPVYKGWKVFKENQEPS